MPASTVRQQWIALDDLAPSATFASSAASPNDAGPENLALPHVGDHFRAINLDTDGTVVDIDVALAEPSIVDYVFVQRPRYRRRTELKTAPVLRPADTIETTFWSDEIDGAVEQATPAAACNMAYGVGVWGHWRYDRGPVAAFRLRFDAQSLATPPNNLLDLGVIRFGRAKLLPPFRALKTGLKSKSRTARPASGARVLRRGAEHWRSWPILFRGLKHATEFAPLQELFLDLYDGSPVVIGLSTDDPQNDWMTTFIADPELERLSVNYLGWPIPLEEYL